MCQTCSLAQLRPTATGGCLQAPTRSLKTAVFSTLSQREPPQRCAIAGRGLNGGIYASVWPLPPRATSSRVHLPNTSCALTVVFDGSVWQAPRWRARLVRVVVRRRGPTTGARAPVARVPESSSLVLGSTHCQQRTQRATRASTLMHSTADFSAAPPRSRLRGPHA